MTDNLPSTSTTIKQLGFPQINPLDVSFFQYSTQEALLLASSIAKTESIVQEMHEIRKQYGGDPAFDNEPGANTPVNLDLNLRKLAEVAAVSSSISACVQAMAVNIADFGHSVYPIVKLETKEVLADDGVTVETITIRTDTGETVDDNFKVEYELQRQKLIRFLSSAALDEKTFDDLVHKKSIDRHTCGVGYWEVERDTEKQLVGLYHCLPHTIQPCKLQKTKIPFEQNVRDPLTNEWAKQPRLKRFRKYVQFKNAGLPTYFKEFGDPRRMDAKTGYYYDPELPEDMLPLHFSEATEIISFPIYHMLYPLGCPWWLPSASFALAARAAELVNLKLFNNNCIPPGILIIEGYKDGMMEEKIKDALTVGMRDGANYSSLLVLQVEGKIQGPVGPNATPVKPSVRVESLAPLLDKEGLFMDYMKFADEKVTMSFRLANQYVGKNNDLNRSVAEVAQDITESQVFQPERNQHDGVMNEVILPELGISYWGYMTNASLIQDKKLLGETTFDAVKTGIMTRDEGRSVIGPLVNEDLAPFDEDWSNVPVNVWEKQQDLGMTPEAPKENEQAPVDVTAAPIAESAGTNQATEKMLAGLSDEDKEHLAYNAIAKMIELRDNVEVKGMYIVANNGEHGPEITIV